MKITGHSNGNSARVLLQLLKMMKWNRSSDLQKEKETPNLARPITDLLGSVGRTWKYITHQLFMPQIASVFKVMRTFNQKSLRGFSWLETSYTFGELY